NTMSPALMVAMGVPPQGAAAIAERRQLAPFASLADVTNLGLPASGMIVGNGRATWTVRATARLGGRDGMPSDVVRSASAVVKLLDPRVYDTMPIWVIRWYDDAWS